jgi:hypothetical protein
LNKRILKSNNKTKTTWSIVNELLGKQHYTRGIQEINIEGKCLTTQQDIANAFNTYVSTTIDKTNMDGNPHTYCYLDRDVGVSYPLLVFKTFPTQEILPIIRSIQTKNSSGYDKISTKLSKISAKYICPPLIYICNKFVLTRIFPEQLKYSTIKPLYKKGDKTDPCNCRPISLLT